MSYDGRGFLATAFHQPSNPALSGTTTPTYSTDGLTNLDLNYLTTDHLGTPVLATRPNGNLGWSGGFEPFGEDWAGAQAVSG